jgi:glycosyltransferase involved in cell wall biosynthesis
MKKVIIQIPCYNEEENLRETLEAIPRNLPGIECVEWLIINDGSTDKTVEVAMANGVDHIVDFNHHQGLAKAFIAGLEACLRLDADIIVNLDADNQYNADDIPKLIEPILQGNAEIVVGERPISQIKHFSHSKKLLQRLGSWVIRVVSNTDVPDATSGFRAISRHAALQLNVFNEYTYTLEMIIQAGQKGIPILSVPIGINNPVRPSRLIKSIPDYIRQSALTIILIFMTYKPLRFFVLLGSIPFFVGLLLCLRWIILFLGGPKASSLPSLILAAILLITGFQLWIFGLVADLMSVNRKILEEIQLRIRKSGLK